jgi:hypothetical protein
MPNWKSKSDTEVWWSNQPGNRGRTYPGDDIAEKQYQRNQAAGENNLSRLRNFFFGKSDERKRAVEDAVNARRDAGTSMKLEPYVAPNRDSGISINEFGDRPSFVPPRRDKRGNISLYEVNEPVPTEGRADYEDVKPVDYDSYGLKKGGSAKKHAKGGKISLDNCKVSTHQKNKKQPNW